MLYTIFEQKLGKFTELIGWISAVAISLAAAILSYEVLSRYLFNTPTIWEIETSIYLLMFAGFVGGAYGLKVNSHIGIEILAAKLKPKPRNWLAIITSILCLIFCLAVAYKAWQMWYDAYELDWHSESLWGPPLWIPYLTIPVGFTLFSLQYVLHIGNLIRKLKHHNDTGLYKRGS